MTTSITKRKDKDTINNLGELTEAGQLIKMIEKHYNLSQIYMNYSLLFINEDLPHVSIILCEHALESMLRALYIKENHVLSHPRVLSLDDLTQFSFKSSVVDLDTMMLIYSTEFLSHLEDYSLFDQIHKAHFIKFINRVDDVLVCLSSKVDISSSGRYNSIQNGICKQ